LSPNLLEELEGRSREAPPRHRLIVRKEPLSVEQQVAHPGPVWLDRLRNDSLGRDHFGAELRDAIVRRGEALRKIDIQPDGSKRTEQLRDLERRTVAKEFVARTGQAFVENIPPAFRYRAANWTVLGDERRARQGCPPGAVAASAHGRPRRTTQAPATMLFVNAIMLAAVVSSATKAPDQNRGAERFSGQRPFSAEK
jgi:hypothetical protein